MKGHLLSLTFLLFALLLLACGCSEPPLKEPVVTVQDIALSDISLRTMTVNTTVVIDNPNPVGARLSRVAFDVYYLNPAENYLGHGERTGIDVKESGNTTVTIPVTIGTLPAIQAVGALVRDGAITIRVNGSAIIDLKVTSFEKTFEQRREFRYEDFAVYLPVSSLAGTGINVTDRMQQLGGLLGQVAGG